MKLYNICFVVQTEKGRNYGNINVTTKKRLQERIRDLNIQENVIYAKIRYEELLNGEYRVKHTEEIINKIS